MKGSSICLLLCTDSERKHPCPLLQKENETKQDVNQNPWLQNAEGWSTGVFWCPGVTVCSPGDRGDTVKPLTCGACPEGFSHTWGWNCPSTIPILSHLLEGHGAFSSPALVPVVCLSPGSESHPGREPGCSNQQQLVFISAETRK